MNRYAVKFHDDGIYEDLINLDLPYGLIKGRSLKGYTIVEAESESDALKKAGKIFWNGRRET